MKLDHRVTIKLALDPSLVALLKSGLAAMSALSDHLDALEAKIDAATSRVLADINALEVQVRELTDKIAAGTATPEEIARLEQLTAKVDQINPETASTITD